MSITASWTLIFALTFRLRFKILHYRYWTNLTNSKLEIRGAKQHKIANSIIVLQRKWHLIRLNAYNVKLHQCQYDDSIALLAIQFWVKSTQRANEAKPVKASGASQNLFLSDVTFGCIPISYWCPFSHHLCDTNALRPSMDNSQTEKLRCVW